MTTIQVLADHATSEFAYKDVARSHAMGIEVWPQTAVTVASWWQSPGSVGRELAAFASGCAVDRTALLDDIAATRQAEGYNDNDGRMSDQDKLAFDMLATFVINHRSDER